MIIGNSLSSKADTAFNERSSWVRTGPTGPRLGVLNDFRFFDLFRYFRSFLEKPITERVKKNRVHSLIQVFRHPDKVGENAVWYYAHHEKIVCIDQDVCFLGGFDLCFGRWDNHSHPVTDCGFIKAPSSVSAVVAEEEQGVGG